MSTSTAQPVRGGGLELGLAAGTPKHAGRTLPKEQDAREHFERLRLAAFAAAHPERVRRLILSGSPGGVFPRLGLFLQLWATPGIGALISRIKFRDTETLRKRAFGGILVHPDRLPTDLLEVALAGINLPGTAETNRAILQNVATFRGWRPEMRLDDPLAALEVPALFAWGAKDQLAPADVGRDLVERMSSAQLAVIDDAGHIPHIDQPGAVATAMNEF